MEKIDYKPIIEQMIKHISKSEVLSISMSRKIEEGDSSIHKSIKHGSNILKYTIEIDDRNVK